LQRSLRTNLRGLLCFGESGDGRDCARHGGCSSVLVEHHNGIVGVRVPSNSARARPVRLRKPIGFVDLHRRVSGPVCFGLRAGSIPRSNRASSSLESAGTGVRIPSAHSIAKKPSDHSEGFFVLGQSGCGSDRARHGGCSSVLVERQSAIVVQVGMTACLNGFANPV